jgi:hypothetical protein
LPIDLQNKIWLNENAYNPLRNDTVDYLNINFNGKYHQYLNRLLKNNTFPALANYIQSIELSGGFSPVSIQYFQNNYKNLDLNNESIRLIIAINFIIYSNQNIILNNKPS